MTDLYNSGLQNGRLCRKYSNQHTTPPTDREWTTAFVDGNYGIADDEKGIQEFIRGCKDGWARSSGAIKV